MLDLLTPVAMTYPSEMGIQSVSQSLQCFGGYGYCEDYPVEQHFRDMRIHPIHEGTTGIQAMDLLGRKVMMENGRAMTLLKSEIEATLQRARAIKALAGYADELEKAVARLEKTTLRLVGIAMDEGAEAFLADAALYLEVFGHIVIGWQWLAMAAAASEQLAQGDVSKQQTLFYQGKQHTAAFYFSHELPKTHGLFETLSSGQKTVITVSQACFTS